MGDRDPGNWPSLLPPSQDVHQQVAAWQAESRLKLGISIWDAGIPRGKLTLTSIKMLNFFFW